MTILSIIAAAFALIALVLAIGCSKDKAEIKKANTPDILVRYYSLAIMSWKNIGENNPRAIAAVDYSFQRPWFETALNCMRDGDMGGQDEDGDYKRLWGSDEVGYDDLRPATIQEVNRYLRKVPLPFILGENDSGKEVMLIWLKDQPYLIYPSNSVEV